MIIPKVSLTLIFRGNKIVSQQVAENKPEDFIENNSITFFTKKDGKKIKDTISFNTRKTNYIKQVINISEESYKAMLSDSVSEEYNKIVSKTKSNIVRKWDTVPKNKRVELHCRLIAESLGAEDFEFYIFDI